MPGHPDSPSDRIAALGAPERQIASAMDSLPGIADRWPWITGRLAELGIEPDGPPFVRYHVIDMATDPAAGPDPQKRRTEPAFRLADQA